MSDDRLPKPLRRQAAAWGVAHIPYWNEALQEEFCHADGEPYPCLHVRQTAPPRCRCSHAKSTHTGGAGQCWNVACGCGSYRTPAVPEHLDTSDINDYRRQKGEL